MFAPMDLLKCPIGDFDDSDIAALELKNHEVEGNQSFTEQTKPLVVQRRELPTESNRDDVELNDWDVLLGRAQHIRSFIGNARFRQLIEEYRPEYNQHERKAEKTYISTQIFNQIRANGGRFLDRSKEVGENESRPIEDGGWYEISDDKALSKISQSLRKGTRPTRKELLLKMRRKQQQAAEKRKRVSLPEGMDDEIIFPISMITVPVARPIGVHSREVTDASEHGDRTFRKPSSSEAFLRDAPLALLNQDSNLLASSTSELDDSLGNEDKAFRHYLY